MKIKILLKETSEDQKRMVIRAFIQARETHDIKKLASDLQLAGFSDPLKAIKVLNTNEVDSEFYQNACEQHNNMARDLGKDEEIVNVDAFPHFPEINANPYKSPDPYGMRSPKLKTMRENNMKITKEYLIQVIQEAIDEAVSSSQAKSMKKKSMNLGKDRVKLKGRHLKTDIPRDPEEKNIEPDEEDKDKE